VRAAIFLVLIGCGSGNPPGSLVCKASRDTGSPRVTVAVPANGLAGARDRAERIGKLVDCTFEESTGSPNVELVKLEDDRSQGTTDTLRDLDPPPPPPDDDPPPPPPPPPAPPRNVPPTLLESYRISGNRNIQPDDDTRLEIVQSGKSKIVGAFKLCLKATGEISTVTQLKSTGFTDYDKKLMTKMREWKYRPYDVDGDPIPVCTAVTFIYSAP